MSSIFTLEKLFHAYQDCRKGKGRTANALLFELDREKNLISLTHDLSSRTYAISRHIRFIATHPAIREIFAADFRDRVVHHLFYNELHAFSDQLFIRHSYANRLNKGTHAAVRAVKEFVRHNPDGYYLKLDVRSFFPSINKAILARLVECDIQLCAEFRMSHNKNHAGGGSELLTGWYQWMARRNDLACAKNHFSRSNERFCVQR